MQDWNDLWRPELAGRISMVDSPREVIGAVFKYMGASYNTRDISREIPGGIIAVQQNLALFAKQVLLFDSRNYLKAFSVGDAWVAVGWSSDILPAAKRMSMLQLLFPSLEPVWWADLLYQLQLDAHRWKCLGGRIRGPSPLMHQWLDFCVQPARELPFKQGVFPGALPSTLEGVPTEVLPKGAPKLPTNLISGVPPPEILDKCEFLEPLSEAALSDYKWLISTMKKPAREIIQQIFATVSNATRMKLLLWRKEN
ncbi:Spermidine/putrescine-binding periplasmic protein 1 [Bienertia sinuspersici]